MSKYDNLPFHPTMEKVVEILMKRTQNENPVFFRLVVSYFFSKVASMMRTNVALGEAQVIPVNMYAMNLAPSGSGKGHSVNIIEEQIIGAFREKFLETTFPEISEKNIARLATSRSARNKSDDKDELALAKAEFREQGVLLFSFDSGTAPALKQMRTKLLMAGAGSMNLEMDEIGSNFTGNKEMLDAYLELFDKGKIKPKLIKNTRENIRSEDLFGATPTNMLLFGTPTKLLNGAKEEDQFYEMLETGYARRCFFGFSRFKKAAKNMTAQKMYDLYHDGGDNKYMVNLSDKLQMLSEKVTFGQTLKFKKDVLFELYDYQIWCAEQASALSEYEEVRQAEIIHRYFKVAKLAATYAFIDKSTFITSDHLKYAIAMAEESGRGFKKILSRDRAYVKLCNYIVSVQKELTHADLMEDLPFYKGSEVVRREMMNLAIAHGYKEGMYIKREIVDGIEFLSGTRVEETNLDKMILSYSTKMAKDYEPHKVPFDQLHRLVNENGYHWCNHHLKDKYRDNAHVIPGSNMVVLDVEDSVDVDTAKMLLADYKWIIHTTKNHTTKKHRFRIVIPMTHILELTSDEYSEFMQNVYDWLPFEVDTATKDRCRKWMTCKGNYWYNDGLLLDSLQFIPKTKKADERKQTLAGQTNLSNLERWFLNNTGGANTNRNYQMMKYAFACVDTGQDVATVRSNLMSLNSRLQDPLDTTEIDSTIMVGVSKRVHTKKGA
jgi:hypothetical protein